MTIETTLEAAARQRRDDRMRSASEQRLVRQFRPRHRLFNR